MKNTDFMKAVIGDLSVKSLIELWNETEKMPRQQINEAAIIRGVLMDRLEEINPVAFENWLEGCETMTLEEAFC